MVLPPVARGRYPQQSIQRRIFLFGVDCCITCAVCADLDVSKATLCRHLAATARLLRRAEPDIMGIMPAMRDVAKTLSSFIKKILGRAARSDAYDNGQDYLLAPTAKEFNGDPKLMQTTCVECHVPVWVSPDGVKLIRQYNSKPICSKCSGNKEGVAKLGNEH